MFPSWKIQLKRRLNCSPPILHLLTLICDCHHLSLFLIFLFQISTYLGQISLVQQHYQESTPKKDEINNTEGLCLHDWESLEKKPCKKKNKSSLQFEVKGILEVSENLKWWNIRPMTWGMAVHIFFLIYKYEFLNCQRQSGIWHCRSQHF